MATFNCHCLLDQPAERATAIAAQAAVLELDALALQEVCETPGAGDNFAAQIAAGLLAQSGRAWETRFARTHTSWELYDEGLAIVAPSGTVAAWGEQPLPQGSGPFPRKVLWARLQAGHGELLLYDAHLTISSDWTDRLAQVQAILGLVTQQQEPDLPQLVVGDFNDKDWSGPIQAMLAGPPVFVDAWAPLHPGRGATIPAPQPSERIDYIFLRQQGLGTLQRVELAFDAPVDGLWLSDHLGVFAQWLAN